jgi:hypothetical protein
LACDPFSFNNDCWGPNLRRVWHMKKLLFGLICVVPNVAFAQFIPQFNVPMSIVNPAIDVTQSQRDQSAPDPDRSSGVGRSEARTLTAVNYVFRPSVQLRRTNLANFVEKTRAIDRAGAAQMATLFASTDIIAEMDRLMQASYGMRANNVADAYAMWWTSAWMGLQGRSDDPSAGQMAMVKRQAANALASTPEFASATDATKQELSEALLVQAAMIQGTIDAYKSDPAMLAKARAAIAKGANGMGLDLSTMTLTDEGFVPAIRKTGAVGSPKETQRADAQPTQAAGDDNPPFLLMAAAGGAGIGGVFMLGKMMGRRG